MLWGCGLFSLTKIQELQNTGKNSPSGGRGGAQGGHRLQVLLEVLRGRIKDIFVARSPKVMTFFVFVYLKDFLQDLHQLDRSKENSPKSNASKSEEENLESPEGERFGLSKSVLLKSFR